MEKFYVVVRDDLAPGLMLAQVGHAAYAYGMSSPRPERTNIAVLSASRERLEALVAAAAERGDGHQPFYEPDLNDEITACAFDGSVRDLVSSLPLALRRYLKCSHTSNGVLEGVGNLLEGVVRDAGVVNDVVGSVLNA
jgi:hypothetical protein